jgi:hypothetical protein
VANINVAFCRQLCVLIAPQVRAAVKAKGLKSKDAWVYKVGPGHWEFHFGEFYWHGSADNAFDARYNGWSAWMRSQGIDIEVPEEDPDVASAERLWREREVGQ